jgi:3-hydroxyacyl-CoA dehydrogenase
LLRDEFVGRLDATSGLRHFDHLLAASERELSLQKAIADSPPVGRLGIVGAGMMGTAIAGVGLRRGLSVSLWDADAGAMRAARGRILEQMQGDLTDADAQRILDRQVALAERPVFPGCGLVIESVVEALAAKRELYRQLEPELEPGTLLASNTSTIPIGQLAAGLADPSRFCGVHFFHPVRRRPLVEIIRGPATSQATVSKATALAKRIGKLPIVVDDGPGFLVNRLLLPYLNEALDLLLEGAEIETVENAATRFGMALGPLHLLDEIGLDTAFRAGMVLYQAFGERIAASPLLVSMVKKGRLGRFLPLHPNARCPRVGPRSSGPDLGATMGQTAHVSATRNHHGPALPADVARGHTRSRRRQGRQSARRGSGSDPRAGIPCRARGVAVLGRPVGTPAGASASASVGVARTARRADAPAVAHGTQRWTVLSLVLAWAPAHHLPPSHGAVRVTQPAEAGLGAVAARLRLFTPFPPSGMI